MVTEHRSPAGERDGRGRSSPPVGRVDARRPVHQLRPPGAEHHGRRAGDDRPAPPEGEPGPDVRRVEHHRVLGEVTGAVVVSFQREAAVRIVSAFAGIEISADSPDFADAVGELANMIAGSAKKDLDSVASITVPSVIIGHGHTIAGLSDVPTVVIPCTTPVGSLAVEVSIKQSKARA
jgi:hypothetical protein